MPYSSWTIKFVIIEIETNKCVIEKVCILTCNCILIYPFCLILHDYFGWKGSRSCWTEWDVVFTIRNTFTHKGIPNIFAPIAGAINLRHKYSFRHLFAGHDVPNRKIFPVNILQESQVAIYQITDRDTRRNEYCR